MKKCNEASIDSIETFGLVDGPGIRTVIFFNGCKLRCKYCHNPEMQQIKENNIDINTLYKKILRSVPYFKNGGGVTFSGGEPLLHSDFLIELCKKLKKNNINICLDTAGVGNGNYIELLKYIDTVLLDIKHIDKDNYKFISGIDYNEIDSFISSLNKSNCDVWIRQVITPNFNDNYNYMDDLVLYLKKIKNIKRVDFLPFHRLGYEKYLKLNKEYPLGDLMDMSRERCNELYNYFIKKFNITYKG